MDFIVSLIASLAANVVTHLVCKWLEGKRSQQQPEMELPEEHTFRELRF